MPSALLLFPASDIIISAPGVSQYYGLECVTLTSRVGDEPGPLQPRKLAKGWIKSAMSGILLSINDYDVS